MLEHRRHASSKEQIERLIDAKIDAIRGQGFRKAAATQHLAIDQDAVAVEDDEIGLGHCKFFQPQSEHILIQWAITLLRGAKLSISNAGLVTCPAHYAGTRRVGRQPMTGPARGQER